MALNHKPRSFAGVPTWVRRNCVAIVVILIATSTWAYLLGNGVYRGALAYIVAGPGNQTPVMWDRWQHLVQESIAYAVIVCFPIALWAFTRWRLRPGLYLILLFTVGAGFAWLTAGIELRYMSAIMGLGPNTSATMGLTPLVGIAAAWGVFFGATAFLEHYRLTIRVTRLSDAHKALCPVCRFDLVASTTGVCPECGWAVPPALRG